MHTPRSNNKCSVIFMWMSFTCFGALSLLFNYVWAQGVAGSFKRLGKQVGGQGVFWQGMGVFW